MVRASIAGVTSGLLVLLVAAHVSAQIDGGVAGSAGDGGAYGDAGMVADAATTDDADASDDADAFDARSPDAGAEGKARVRRFSKF